MRTRPTANKGFTVIELLVAVALFSLVLSMCYQALMNSSEVYDRVSESSLRQQSWRITYRSLRDALKSGGQISGAPGVLTIDLSLATTRWTQINQKLRFEIVNDDELWVFNNSRVGGERLLSQVDGLSFLFGNADGEFQTHWTQESRPLAVSLSWAAGVDAMIEAPLSGRNDERATQTSDTHRDHWLFVSQ